MLLGRYHANLAGCGKLTGGTSESVMRLRVFKLGSELLASCGGFGRKESDGTYQQVDSIPCGSYPPYSYKPPIKAGAMSSHRQVKGAGSLRAAIAGGLSGRSTMSAAAALDARMMLLAHFSAHMSGRGTLTKASLAGVVNAVAHLAANGSLEASATGILSIIASLAGGGTLSADVSGALGAKATLAGSAELQALGSLVGLISASLHGASELQAEITGAWPMEATLTGSSSLTAAVPPTPGHLSVALVGLGSIAAVVSAEAGISATLSAQSELSPQSLAAAVWNAVAANYVETGSMGRLLNASGGGSDPETIAAAVWDALSSATDPETMGRVLVELSQLMGLDPSKPLVVAPTARMAGDIEQTIETTGDTVTVTRQ